MFETNKSDRFAKNVNTVNHANSLNDFVVMISKTVKITFLCIDEHFRT